MIFYTEDAIVIGGDTDVELRKASITIGPSAAKILNVAFLTPFLWKFSQYQGTLRYRSSQHSTQ